MARHQGFNFLKGGLAAGAGALLGNKAGLNPAIGAGLGLLGGSALGGNSSAQRLALGLGPIALAQNAADKRLDAIPGGFSTPFSTVSDGNATIDPSIRSGQQDLLTGLQGNENRFIQARVRPFERQAARQRANISQGLQRRGLGGSSLATNELARFEGQINPLIADQQALATNESLQAQNQLLNQRFNQELAALGLGAQDVQLLTQQAQLKTDLLGRTIDATGKILAPGTTNITGGAAGAGGQQGGGIGDFLSGGIDKAIGGITDFFGGNAGVGAGLGLAAGALGPSAGLGIGDSLGFGAGAVGNLASAAPGFGAGAILPGAGNFFGGGATGLANGAGAFGAPAGFEGLFSPSQGFEGITIPISGGGSGASAGFAGPTPLQAGGFAGLASFAQGLLSGQGFGASAAQGVGAGGGAALGAQLGAAGGPIGILAGTVIGGFLGGSLGSKLGKALGISTKGGGDDKADYQLAVSGSGAKAADYGGKIGSGGGPYGSVGFFRQKHLTQSNTYQKGFDAIMESDKAIANSLTPEQNAQIKAKLGSDRVIKQNRNEGGFSPLRAMGYILDDRESVIKGVIGPQQFAQLGLDKFYNVLRNPNG